MDNLVKGTWIEQDDEELKRRWIKGKNLLYEYNNLNLSQTSEIERVKNELFKSVGKNTTVTPPIFCDFGSFTSIGDGCFINANCVFLDTNEITIGDYTLIGPGVHIYCADHPLNTNERIVPKDDRLNDDNYSYIDDEGKFDKNIEYTFTEFSKPVKIGDRCWIGGKSIILPGVTIGDNVVIGAGSIVTHDIPSNTKVKGRPARIYE
jgi:maltose O-acetyltransferase